jgi:hypothetical protein
MPLLTADSVGAQLARLGQELDQLVEVLGAQELKAIHVKAAAQRKEAKAYLGAEGPVEERKREAYLYAADALESAEVEEAVVRHVKSQIRAVEARIDIGRTLGATVRAELATLASVPS